MMSDEQHPGGVGVKLGQTDEDRVTTYDGVKLARIPG